MKKQKLNILAQQKVKDTFVNTIKKQERKDKAEQEIGFGNLWRLEFKLTREQVNNWKIVGEDLTNSARSFIKNNEKNLQNNLESWSRNKLT